MLKVVYIVTTYRMDKNVIILVHWDPHNESIWKLYEQKDSKTGLKAGTQEINYGVASVL
jgi:hypothetical protein